MKTYKARLVGKGYIEKQRLNYEKKFLLLVMIKFIRIMLAITTYYGYEISQMNVKTTFLNRFMEENINMQQFVGFVFMYPLLKDIKCTSYIDLFMY